MRSDPVADRTLARRWRVVLVLALTLLLPVPCPADAEPVAGGPEPAVAAHGAATSASTQSTAPAERAREEHRSGTSNVILPLVLAAILFLAILAPPSMPHAHRHWHSG